MARAAGVVVQHARAARREAERDLVGQPLARRHRVVPVAHDDGRIGVIDVVPFLGIPASSRTVLWCPSQPTTHCASTVARPSGCSSVASMPPSVSSSPTSFVARWTAPP